MIKEILFRGKKTDNGEVVEGYYGIKGKGTDLEKHFIMTNEFQHNVTIPFFYFFDNEVIPESVEQYSHTAKNGERIFKPIFSTPKSRADKMREMKEGDVMTFDRNLYGSIRAHCSAINKNRKSKLKTKLSNDGTKIHVIVKG
jgi:hypothetical protein